MIRATLTLALACLAACGGGIGPTVDAGSPVDASAGILDGSVDAKPIAMDAAPDSPSSCDPCDPDAGGNAGTWYCAEAHKWSICDPTTPTSGTGCLIHYACEHDAGGE